MRMNWKFNTDEWLKIKRGNRKKTILVVDDEPSVITLYTHILREAHYEVATATTGATGGRTTL